MSPAAAPRMSERERTMFLAMAMAMVALGIDLLLPAFADIRSDLGLAADSTAVAGLITAYFLGLALGGPIWGPLSDQMGRKTPLWISFALYIVGALATAVAPTLPMLLLCRFIWGLGAAGPRTLIMAIIRDRYEGDAMSKAMSLVMAIFLIIPVFAPAVGAAGVAVVSWRWIVVATAISAVAVVVWSTRLAESLAPEHRTKASFAGVRRAATKVVTNRETVLLSVGLTILYAAFTSYLASSELIFSDVFGQADAFPVIFGGVALFMAGAMLSNSWFIDRFGGNRLTGLAMNAYLAGAAVLAVSALLTGGRPPLWVFLAGITITMCSQAILFPNLNALAMVPMGEVAGMASALIGAVQVAIGALLGAVIDSMFDGTVMPLSLAFLGLGSIAAVLIRAGVKPATPVEETVPELSPVGR